MIRLRNIFTLMGCLFCLAWSQVSMAQTGTVLAFGNNEAGQLGDNTTTNRSLAVPAFKISGIKAVSCGFSHTLALDSAGQVWAWGSNDSGQLGIGGTTPSSVPVLVTNNIKAIAASSYGSFSLALDASGRVWAWGANESGQLGTGDTINRFTPALMNSFANTRIKAIAAGGAHSLVLTETGLLYGCGMNAYGQLAQGDFAPRLYLSYMASFVVGMAGGGYHTLMQTSSNNVYAAGYDGYGELGDGGGSSKNLFVLCMTSARSISAGAFHNAAVTLAGNLVTWGYNGDGQLGMGDTIDRSAATLVPNVSNVKAVAAGGYHTIVQTGGGTVLGTGYNIYGQLGDGTFTNRTSLVPVKNASFIWSITAGAFYSVILKPFTNVLATGLNTHGQLGLGHLRQQNTPVQVSNIINYIAVASGNSNGNHSLALRADGLVVAWGSNNHGQLGIGTTTDNLVPVAVKGPGGVGNLTNIIAIAAGDDFSLALAANGIVFAWGSNDHGQLGNGDYSHANQLYPVQIDSHNVFAIAAGAKHSLLLRDDGRIWTVGLNDNGQLGLGYANFEDVYFQQINSGGFTAIAGGGAHSLALNCTGEIYAWGSNYTGQLGLGDAAIRLSPTREPGTAAIGITCGGNHSTHFNGGGDVYGTGGNPFGELGLLDTVPRYSWTLDTNAFGTTGISGGLDHSLFLDVTGNLWAAGLGASGQLGNGSTANVIATTLVGSFFPGAVSMAGGAGHTLILTVPRTGLASLTINPTAVKGGASAIGTVTLKAPAGPGGYRLYLSFYSLDPNGNYVNGGIPPPYVDVPAGSKTASFTIPTLPVSLTTLTLIDAYNGAFDPSLPALLTVQP